ncbi:hypothetical protein CDA63_09065 [Hymenobacter amundsenii]|uniref:Uncharacterized protein n=1 Tax=Hymenobacter amundsenii TaxID=2006685 RepID=A0A246FKT5_9BACT|nr:hypothetical protein [Hymenobacter amundsenii]OWP63348.1 hypothetical protein CDA63_09065 [Hymenobacter amundsenii]
MTNDDLQQASTWTRNYRNQNTSGVNAHCLPAETLQNLLGQSGCVGVRAYYGLDDAGQPQLVLVGYDAQDNDLLAGPPVAARSAMIQDVEPQDAALETTQQLATNLPICPPCCSVTNALNS